MAATVDRTRVRVEDGSSMGRSYTASSNKRAGLGAERRGLTDKSFNIDDDSERNPLAGRAQRALCRQ